MVTKTQKKPHKLKVELMLTPDRGYLLDDIQWSFRIPHNILKDLFGNPITKDYRLADDELGCWYIDITGEPLRFALVDPDKRLERKKKNHVNPIREEVVRIYGNGHEAPLLAWNSLMYALWGEVLVRKWKNFDKTINGIFRKVEGNSPKELVEIFEYDLSLLYDEFVDKMNELHSDGKLDNEINDKILEIEYKVDKLHKMITQVKKEIGNESG